MYILTAGNKYVCTDYRPTPDSAYFCLPQNAPTDLGEVVALMDENGFELASQTVADFQRWYTAGEYLVLTNTPEEPPVPPADTDGAQGLGGVKPQGGQNTPVVAENEEGGENTTSAQNDE